MQLRRTMVMMLVAMMLAGLLAGCANPESLVRPGRFAHYNCDQLAFYGKDRAQRERQLKHAIERASQGGAAGEAAIALAYRTEFLTVQDELKELDIAATNRKCSMPWRSISEQAVR